MKNQLGLSTSLYDEFIPDKHLPIIAAAGIQVIELTKNVFDRIEDAALFNELKTEIEKAGLKVNSIHVPFSHADDISQADPAGREATQEKALLCMRRAEELEARCIVIHPSAEPIEDDQRETRRAAALASLRELDVRAGNNPVRIAVEILPRTCLLHESAEIVAFMEALDNPRFGICQDVNHSNLREDVVDATQTMGSWIITTHISDNDGEDERHWLPGRGIIPWQNWRDVLLDSGYKGPFLYEVRAWDDDGNAVSDADLAVGVRANFTEVFEL